MCNQILDWGNHRSTIKCPLQTVLIELLSIWRIVVKDRLFKYEFIYYFQSLIICVNHEFLFRNCLHINRKSNYEIFNN